jgi:hypothetical protein
MTLTILNARTAGSDGEAFIYSAAISNPALVVTARQSPAIASTTMIRSNRH